MNEESERWEITMKKWKEIKGKDNEMIGKIKIKKKECKRFFYEWNEHQWNTGLIPIMASDVTCDAIISDKQTNLQCWKKKSFCSKIAFVYSSKFSREMFEWYELVLFEIKELFVCSF